MDYIEAFRCLKTNNKYSRKSPHKAILLLSIMEMYEKDALPCNEIFYNESLTNTFLEVWNRSLPNETKFLPEAYLPFWYMQTEGFWHIIPNSGKHDVVSKLRSENIKPSESKILECVHSAVLDEDLYFMITLPSTRSALKRALLETYTNLSQAKIDALSSSVCNVVDNSITAMNEYVQLLNSSKSIIQTTIVSPETIENKLDISMINEELQLALCVEYYSFLRRHRQEREFFREVCPTVNDLYERITVHPAKLDEINPLFASTYENFLCDLKYSIMGEEGSLDLVDSINDAIDELRYKGATEDVPGDHEQDEDLERPQTVSDKECENEQAQPSFSDEFNNSSDYTVENELASCSIYNSLGIRVFYDEGNLKSFSGNMYRFNYKEMCFTVKDVLHDGDIWEKGSKQLVAYIQTDLYSIIDKGRFIEQIEDFVESDNWERNRIKVDGKWYDFEGNLIIDAEIQALKIVEEDVANSDENTNPSYIKTKSPLTILRATRPDGSIIQNDKAASTFCQVIKEIGPQKVIELNIILDGLNLVLYNVGSQYIKDFHDIGGGYYVNTHSSTMTKKRQLDRIFQAFNLAWKVEIV